MFLLLGLFLYHVKDLIVRKGLEKCFRQKVPYYCWTDLASRGKGGSDQGRAVEGVLTAMHFSKAVILSWATSSLMATYMYGT